MSDKEVKLLSPIESIHAFAKQLTSKVRELDVMEREWKISTGEATAILEQMIEAQLYAVFKALIASNYPRQEEKEAAFKAITQLLSSNDLSFAPKPPVGDKK